MPDTKNKSVICKLKADFGGNVFTCKWTQFTLEDFREFSHKWDFDHHILTLAYPQNNGKSELAVKTSKRLLHVCFLWFRPLVSTFGTQEYLITGRPEESRAGTDGTKNQTPVTVEGRLLQIEGWTHN